MKNTICLFAVLTFCAAAAEQLPLPAPVPVFDTQTAAETPAPMLEIKNFHVKSTPYDQEKRPEGIYQQPTLLCGNKGIAVRCYRGSQCRVDTDSFLQILIDGKYAGDLMWWGNFGKQWGFPYRLAEGKHSELTCDPATQTIHYRRPYLLPDGREAFFSYTLKPADKGQVRLEWDMGVTQAEAEKLTGIMEPPQLWLSFSGRDDFFSRNDAVFNGKIHPPSDKALLLNKGGQRTAVVMGDLKLVPKDDPANGYSVSLGDAAVLVYESFQRHEENGIEEYNTVFRRQPKTIKAQDNIVIDFGKVKSTAAAPQTASGSVDWWRDDALHVSPKPTRNLMNNPSFEEGFCYWTWQAGGARYSEDRPYRENISSDALFGKKALQLNDTQKAAAMMRSFPIALEEGKTYTLSFYAKAEQPTTLVVGLASAGHAGKFGHKQYGNILGDIDSPESRFQITQEWKRYSRTFAADLFGIQIVLGAWKHRLLIDGIQLEEGKSPTPFVTSPIEADLSTSSPDNSVMKGKPLDARLLLHGKPGQKGNLTATVSNIFREVLFKKDFLIEITADGEQRIPLDLDLEKLDEGIFLVRMDYQIPGFRHYWQYRRFAIMAPLSNTHATKDIFGTHFWPLERFSRSDELAEKYKEWGFGSTSWGYSAGSLLDELLKKNQIANYMFSICAQGRENAPNAVEYMKWEQVTPELAEKIKQEARLAAAKYRPGEVTVWSLGNEESGGRLIAGKKYEDHFRANLAAAEGIWQADPKALFAPTNGTSGFSLLRGYEQMKMYLETAAKHGFKYGAIGVHMYWNIDKGTLSNWDLDEETARLFALMSQYGYGKETPVFFPEMFNVPWVHIPEWDVTDWNDGCRAIATPSYDIGNRELIHGASAARIWIIALKYWPRVKATNVWIERPFMDMNLFPIVMCKAANTMGHLMPWVEYYGEARPGTGIRAYVFTLKDKSAIAAVWTSDKDVENGFQRGPRLNVAFGQDIQFYDLMGTQRSENPDRNGITAVPLTPAPLFLKAADPAKLVSALKNAVIDNPRFALKTTILPTLDGPLSLAIRNLTGNKQEGKAIIANHTIPYSISGLQTSEQLIPNSSKGCSPGQMYRYDATLSILPNKGKATAVNWNMNYFYVPKCGAKPDWSKIPAIELHNYFGVSGKVADADLSASYQMAWNEKNLFLRVKIKDSDFIVEPAEQRKGYPLHWNRLWRNDGCLEVYFDCGANALGNLEKDYDNDDYRYDFAIGLSGKDGPGMVNRYRQVNQQLAGGMAMPSQEEAAANVVNLFQRTPDGYTYEITFPQRYIEPLQLRKGFIAGCALFIHDLDSGNRMKGLSTASVPGSPCDYKPYVWPVMILSGENAVPTIAPNHYFTGVTDKNPLKYRRGEEMSFTIFYTNNGVPVSDIPLQWTISSDDGKKSFGKAISDATKPLVLKTSLASPGFVRVRVAACDSEGKELPGDENVFDGGAAVEPETLCQAIPEPEDFDRFWTEQISRARSIPMETAIREFKSGVDGIRTFEFTLSSASPMPCTGYATLPEKAAPKSLPAIIHFCGYSWMSAATFPNEAKEGFLVLNPNLHGEKNGQSQEYYDNLHTRLTGKLFAFALRDTVDREKCYLNGVILRNIRLFDYLKTIPEWDGKTIIIRSGSMGAFQAVVLAGLFPSAITRCEIAIPWLCDVGGFKVGRAEGFRPDYHRSLDYYDTVNHAKRVRCPVALEFGLGDYVCPPSGVAILRNNFRTLEECTAIQNRRHGYCQPEAQRYSWMKDNQTGLDKK